MLYVLLYIYIYIYIDRCTYTHTKVYGPEDVLREGHWAEGMLWLLLRATLRVQLPEPALRTMTV